MDKQEASVTSELNWLNWFSITDIPTHSQLPCLAQTQQSCVFPVKPVSRSSDEALSDIRKSL